MIQNQPQAMDLTAKYRQRRQGLIKESMALDPIIPPATRHFRQKGVGLDGRARDYVATRIKPVKYSVQINSVHPQHFSKGSSSLESYKVKLVA